MFAQHSQNRSRVLLAAAIGSGLFWLGAGLPMAAQAQGPDPATQLYVSNVHVGWFLAYAGASSRQTSATVDIVDGYGNPVNGTFVIGDWSGCYKRRNDSDTTETVCTTPSGAPIDCVDGRAVIWGKKHNCPGNNCPFTFTITSVQKNGMTYVPVAGKTSSFSYCNPLLGSMQRRTRATLASNRQVVTGRQQMPTRRPARWSLR